MDGVFYDRGVRILACVTSSHRPIGNILTVIVGGDRRVFSAARSKPQTSLHVIAFTICVFHTNTSAEEVPEEETHWRLVQNHTHVNRLRPDDSLKQPKLRVTSTRHNMVSANQSSSFKAKLKELNHF